MAMHTESLCWTCGKACDSSCSWSKDFIPVEGWDAVKTSIGFTDSYDVFKCPEYVKDDLSIEYDDDHRDNYEELINAIIKMAVDDYIELSVGWKDTGPDMNIKDCVSFLKRICPDTSTIILEMADSEIKEIKKGLRWDVERIKHGVYRVYSTEDPDNCQEIICGHELAYQKAAELNNLSYRWWCKLRNLYHKRGK